MSHDGHPPTVSDVVLKGFTPDTLAFLVATVDDLWGLPKVPFGTGDAISFKTAAALFFVLRDTPDDEFPGGKWATIQHLESRIEEAVRP